MSAPHQESAATRERNIARRLALFDKLPDGAIVTTGELKLLANIGRTTIYKEIADGRLPRPSQVQGRNEWTVVQVRAYLASRKRGR